MKRRRRWLPKSRASRSPAIGAGRMEGRGSRKIVLHTSESDPGSLQGVVNWVKSRNTGYHLIIDDKLKKAVQLYPFDKAARSLLNGGINNGVGCNRSGEVCIQICVVGRAKDAPVNSLSPWAIKLVQDIAESWGVPLVVRRNKGRSVKTWLSKSGIYTHAGAPGNDHTDPGWFKRSKFRKVQSPSKPVKVAPTPVPAPSKATVTPKRKARVTKNKDTRWPTDKKLMRKIRRVSKDTGLHLHIRSGYRSWSEQAFLYNQWVKRVPGYNLAAKPGYSRHNSGSAADMGVVRNGKYTSIGNVPKARKAMRRRGLCLPVPGEPWHVEIGSTWRA